MSVLGLDTSNYTTSAAVFDGCSGRNVSRLLQVRPGELGLRQSDALFQHVRNLPELFCALAEEGLLAGLEAVTINAARQYGEEADKGSLGPGKRADLVLLSRDPLEVPPEELRQIQVLETVKGGQTIWKA